MASITNARSALVVVPRASALLARILDPAPPGFAGWTLPVDPLFSQLHGSTGFTSVLARLAERAA